MNHFSSIVQPPARCESHWIAPIRPAVHKHFGLASRGIQAAAARRRLALMKPYDLGIALRQLAPELAHLRAVPDAPRKAKQHRGASRQRRGYQDDECKRHAV